MTKAYRVVPEREITIYAMIEPGTEYSNDPYVRYVGQTGGKIQSRLSRHIADAKASRLTNEALSRWILGLLKRGKRPVIAPLEACTSQTSADMGERFHIDRLRGLYPDLLNLRDNPGRSQGRHFTEHYLSKVS